MKIPKHLARTLAQRGPAGQRWFASLPLLVERLAREWFLAVGDPYEPGGQTSWTAPVVRTTDRSPLVLKIGMPHPEALHEAEGLQVWSGRGAVRVLCVWRDEQASALLLERCEPGSQLKHTLPEPEQDVVIAELLNRLWIEPPEGHGFRPLSEMCALWAGERQRRLAESLAPDTGMLSEGLALWHELPRNADRTAMLLTDLHGGNTLSAQREPWLAIDPKPYIGDPTYDLTQHMTNRKSRLELDPRGLCDRMAGLAGVDGSRLRAWMFARLIVDTSWPFGANDPSNYDVAAQLAP